MKLKLDSILLFALTIPLIMNYNLAPFATPYWLFGLVFFGLTLYLLLDILNLKQKTYDSLKMILLWLILIITVGSSFNAAIIERHITHPTYKIHDMPLQQEIAINYLTHGKNPYSTTYFGTFLQQWHYSDTEVNPALYHFVLMPFYILFAVPFYFLSNHTIGFFDARIPLLFLFLMALLTGAFLIKDRSKKLLFLVLFALNPAMLPYTLEGRSDIFMFAFLFLSLFFLQRKKDFLAGILMALSFAIKQSAWPIFPLYVSYLYFKTRNVKETFRKLIPFMVTFIIVVLPFFLWDKKAFIDSTVNYLSGNLPNSYPIAGYGLGKLLNEFGVIKDLHSYYPFWIWQVLIGIPVLFFLIRWLGKENSVARLVFSYGIFLFVFWYLSRYFNNSHLAYLSMIFLVGYFWPAEKS